MTVPAGEEQQTMGSDNTVTDPVLVSVHLLTAMVIPSNILSMVACHGLSPPLVGSEDDEEMPCKWPKTETKQDYEEWKKKILENASKAQETSRSIVCSAT